MKAIAIYLMNFVQKLFFYGKAVQITKTKKANNKSFKEEELLAWVGRCEWGFINKLKLARGKKRVGTFLLPNK